MKREAISVLEKEKHRRCMRQGNTNLFRAEIQPTYSKHNLGGKMCDPKVERPKKGEWEGDGINCALLLSQ